MFRVVRVDPARALGVEQLGTKRKYWYRGDQGRRMVFKAEDRGTGEDWAEKIACELAELLGLPHVAYELAEENGTGKPGVVCESFTPSPRALVLGNELLLARDPAYPAGEGQRYKVREHTVDAVAEVVQGLALPLPPFAGNPSEGVATALDVFVGYVLLDAWIANQDRHHENWGAVRLEDRLHLAPTFDHGASLARNLTDEERCERLSSRDANRRIPAFVEKARSAFYAKPTDTKPMTTFEAWRALACCVPQASAVWLKRLKGIDQAAVEHIVGEVPPHRMSDICRAFTVELLMENQRRLVAGANR
jgi:hypothetical protein